MRKFNQKRNEKGALIIEVIAVVALLGVMGPMLFNQVKNRNNEVDNVAMASEMRAIKEAFSAYIMADRAKLLADCIAANGGDEDGGDMEIKDLSVLEDFLPIGNNALYSYNLVLNCEGGFLQGFISPIAEAVPENLKLKRAARIANLIGADGGICQDDKINGVAGGWETSPDENGLLCPSEPWVVATTGMDTFTPEVTYEDYSASLVSLPKKLAMEQLHAMNYFSVGGTSECFDIKHNNTGDYDAENGFTAQDDEIKGNTGDCKPAFWVGAADKPDGAENGHVYVKNNLIIGQRNKTGESTSSQAIALFSEGMTESAFAGDPTKNRIEVYDDTGKNRIIINGKGEIIAQDAEEKARVKIDGSEKGKIVIGNASDTSDNETLTLTHQMLVSNKDGGKYKIDPSHTSVMNDIKLEARGGVNLSQVLPKYISKDIIALDTSICQNECNAPVPDCPDNHAPAIIVIPTHWNAKTLKSADIAADLKADITSGTISSNTNKEYTTDDGLYMYIDSNDDLAYYHKNDKISTDGKSVLGNSDKAPKSKWTIEFKDKDGNIRTDVKAIAQTYCVYDGTVSVPSNRDVPTDLTD